jgi:hypothetical protein
MFITVNGGHISKTQPHQEIMSLETKTQVINIYNKIRRINNLRDHNSIDLYFNLYLAGLNIK